MKIFGWKKQIAVSVTWRNHKGQTKSIMKQVVSDHDNTAVIVYPDGKELTVKVFAVKRGTIFGQFLRGGGYGRETT